MSLYAEHRRKKCIEVEMSLHWIPRGNQMHIKLQHDSKSKMSWGVKRSPGDSPETNKLGTCSNSESRILHQLQRVCQNAGPIVEHKRTLLSVGIPGGAHYRFKVVLYSVRINLSPFTKGCRECITLMRIYEFLQGTCLNPFTKIIKLKAVATMIIHCMKANKILEYGPIVLGKMISREF